MAVNSGGKTAAQQDSVYCRAAGQRIPIARLWREGVGKLHKQTNIVGIVVAGPIRAPLKNVLQPGQRPKRKIVFIGDLLLIIVSVVKIVDKLAVSDLERKIDQRRRRCQRNPAKLSAGQAHTADLHGRQQQGPEQQPGEQTHAHAPGGGVVHCRTPGSDPEQRAERGHGGGQ